MVNKEIEQNNFAHEIEIQISGKIFESLSDLIQQSEDIRISMLNLLVSMFLKKLEFTGLINSNSRDDLEYIFNDYIERNGIDDEISIIELDNSYDYEEEISYY